MARLNIACPISATFGRSWRSIFHRPSNVPLAIRGSTKQWSRSMHAYAQHSPIFEAFNLTLIERTGGTIGTFCTRCPHARRDNSGGRTGRGEM